jgi:hypothetical protein
VAIRESPLTVDRAQAFGDVAESAAGFNAVSTREKREQVTADNLA